MKITAKINLMVGLTIIATVLLTFLQQTMKSQELAHYALVEQIKNMNINLLNALVEEKKIAFTLSDGKTVFYHLDSAVGAIEQTDASLLGDNTEDIDGLYNVIEEFRILFKDFLNKNQFLFQKKEQILAAAKLHNDTHKTLIKTIDTKIADSQLYNFDGFNTQGLQELKRSSSYANNLIGEIIQMINQQLLFEKNEEKFTNYYKDTLYYLDIQEHNIKLQSSMLEFNQYSDAPQNYKTSFTQLKTFTPQLVTLFTNIVTLSKKLEGLEAKASEHSASLINISETLKKEKDKTTSVTLLVGQFLFFGLMIIGSFFFSRSITRPLSALVNATRSIHDTSFTDKKYGKTNPLLKNATDRTSKDEISILTNSFVRMETQINQKIGQLQQSEARYRQLFTESNDTILVTSIQGDILNVNPAATAFFGYSKEELLSLNMAQLYANENDREVFIHEVKAKGATHNLEVEFVSKDGRKVFGLANATAKHSKSGEILSFQGIIRDITEKKQMEQQLSQAQKMEAIGTLAGGIAHDFNNILSAILGYTELTLVDNTLAQKTRTNLEVVLSAAQRAKELVKQILMFSRKSETSQEAIQFHLVVKEAVKLLRKTIPTNIIFNVTIDSQTGTIQADTTQMIQVIMNLGTNAYHALRNMGGKLHIQLEQVTIDQKTAAKFPGLTMGRFAQLKVTDNGSGMDPLTLSRIFDPFFTTKEVDEGTGLGLSVVHGIIQNHGGAIGVESSLGKGSIFTVFLPIFEGDSCNSFPDKESIQTGDEHILLVDDEPDLANLWKETLTSLGYLVSSTSSPHEALLLFTSNPNDYDLMLTDQTMPGMTGDALAQKILGIRQNFPIIIYTGHSDIIDEKRASEIGVKALLMKPLKRADLSRAIRDVLEDRI